MIIEIFLLIIILIITILSFLIFLFKNILYIIISLSFLFILNSILFLFLNQPLLAVIQLLITIGGISTYMFIGVSSAELPDFKFTNFTKFLLFAFLIFIIMIYPIKSIIFTNNNQNILSNQVIANNLSVQVPNFYIIAIVLFGISIASILLLKELNNKQNNEK